MFIPTKRLSLLACAMLSMLCAKDARSQAKRSHVLTSPNGNIKLVLENTYRKGDDSNASADLKIYYRSGGKFTEIMSDCELGLSTADEQFRNMELTNAGKITSIKTSYEMITGKRRSITNAANEEVFTFTQPNKKELKVIFRAYNDGVAFRYQMSAKNGTTVNVKDEYTTYHIPARTARWLQGYDSGYERFYPYSTDGKGDKKQEWAFPALFKANDVPVWYLISEANNSEVNCAARLNNSQDANVYKVTYPEPRKRFPQQGALGQTPWTSQWHTISIGSLADVVGSTLVTDVSEPSKIKDTNWIIPGSVSWIYWAYNHGSKDYKKVVEYVDLAKAMNWPYVLIDWEWDAMTNGGNLEDAVKYAHSKGIKPLMWYNSGTTDWSDATPVDRMRTREKRIKEFEWLNKIGVYGVKVDFFDGDQQDMIDLYLDILKDAADHHLMVDFHGATIPRGWARTYPNLMTVEAVYGAEWYNNNDVLTKKAAVHNTTLPFTRNVIGSMDYTPVTFSNSQHPHITSYGHELALSVVFESALQNFADRPEAYLALPEEPRNFLKTVPAAWDDTKLLSGYPGDHVVIARRKGNTWYIGGLNGQENARAMEVDLSLIKPGKAKVSIIQDGDTDTTFKTEDKTFDKGQKVNVNCLPRGGFVMVVE